jgi:hypothetical protein
MSKYPTPTGEGFYWAKLIHPTRMPEGEDWKSIDWEVVEVIINGGDEDDDDYLGVFVGGVGPMQCVEDFVWGPYVLKPKELK